MRKSSILLRAHITLSLLIALPLVWLSATGVLLAFADNIDRIVAVDLMTIAPEKTQPKKHLMDTFIKNTQAKYPEYTLSMITYPNAPSESLRTIWLNEAQQQTEIFIHPYTGTLLGSRLTADSFTTRIHTLHTLIHTLPNAIRLAAMGTIIALGLLVLLSGMWRFAEAQLTSSKIVGSQHALLGLVLLLPMSTILISGLVLLYSEQTTALLWHTGALLGFGGRVVWFMTTLLFACFLSIACIRFLRVRSM